MGRILIRKDNPPNCTDTRSTHIDATLTLQLLR